MLVRQEVENFYIVTPSALTRSSSSRLAARQTTPHSQTEVAPEVSSSAALAANLGADRAGDHVPTGHDSSTLADIEKETAAPDGAPV